MCAQKLDTKTRIAQIDRNNEKISLQRQCELLSINRSSFYYEPKINDSIIDEVIVGKIEAIHINHPALGYRKIQTMLSANGCTHNRKKVLRLTLENNMQAIYPKHKTTIADKQHAKVKYLLRNLEIVRPNQVWAVDITYIKVCDRYVYLFGIIDAFSRKIIAHRLSPFLDTKPCVEAFEEAIKKVFPEIVNSDQGCQFTSDMWIIVVNSCGAKMSMDGVGRWADNIIIERFWRTIKYEFIIFYSFDTLEELNSALEAFIQHYNMERPHQSLNYKTPEFVYTTAQGPTTIIKNKSNYWMRKKEEKLIKEKLQDEKNISPKSDDLIATILAKQSEVTMNI